MLINPPTWTQNGTYTAEQDRRLIGAIVRTEGVTNINSMVPTVVPNSLSVSISDGGAYVEGDFAQSGAGGGGMYFSYNDGAYEVALPVAGIVPRYDLIVLRVYDSAVSGSINEARFDVISGTPSKSPRIPAVPGSATAIAAVKVNPGVTQLQASNISDQRTIAQYNGTVTGSVTSSQASRLDQVASPTNPVLITEKGSPEALRMSTGSGFQVVGGTLVTTSKPSSFPRTAVEGALATTKTYGRTYQFRDGSWKFFAGRGPYITIGRTKDETSHRGPFIGPLRINGGTLSDWGGEEPDSSHDYSSYFSLVTGTSGTSDSQGGGVTLKAPGKYRVDMMFQIKGQRANTKIRSKIKGTGISSYAATDRDEEFNIIGKDEEIVVSHSAVISVTDTKARTYGKLLPWVRTSAYANVSELLFRVALEYEF